MSDKKNPALYSAQELQEMAKEALPSDAGKTERIAYSMGWMDAIIEILDYIGRDKKEAPNA